eukprot:12421537-Karenia_brevis.AAC.1
MVAEKCNEFNLPMWTATLDFKKAYDSISYGSIWDSLIAQGTPATYVHLLSRLYDGQRASVRCDVSSREFAIGKGTKQGDPISPLIFNAVLEHVMSKVKIKWAAKAYGRKIGYNSESFITNLRFADDILLIGRSLPQIKQMVADVAIEGAK